MTTKEAIIIIDGMIVKAQACGFYSAGEIFAYNAAFTKLQENEHSENQRVNPDAQPQEVAKD